MHFNRKEEHRHYVHYVLANGTFLTNDLKALLLFSKSNNSTFE